MTPQAFHQAPEDSSSVPLPILPSGDPERSVTDVEKQAARNSSRKVSAFKSLGLLDRFLALWIFLAMAIGIILGNFVPNTGPALQKGKFVGVSVPIGKLFRLTLWPKPLTIVEAVGLLVMMYPILCKVKYETLHLAIRKREIWVQILFSIFVNWIIAPFLMVIPI